MASFVPDEVTDLDWKDFEELFIFNHQRAELATQLRKLIARVSSWQVDRLQIWIDGSFATLKPHPNDIDLVCFVDSTFYESNQAAIVMRPFDQLQTEIQATLEKIIRVNASIARHETQEQPDSMATAQFEEIKFQFTEHLLKLLAEMDIKLKVAA